MASWEYKTVTDRLRKKVLNEEISPISERFGLKPSVIITHREQDEKIKEMSEEHNYDQIFIASPSKYCQKETKGWFGFGNGSPKVPQGAVCLI